jgi:regulator of protease activity HflC (stomatin/prohibitin superfamily)
LQPSEQVFVRFLGVEMQIRQNAIAMADEENSPVSAVDIAAECDRRAAIHRAEADKLEKVAGLLRGVLALTDVKV